MRFYDVTIQIQAPLDADAGDQFITTIRAVVNCNDHTDANDTPEPVRAGKAQAYFVDASRAIEVGENIFDICDMHSHELMECHSVLFTKNEYNDDIAAYSPLTSNPDFLFLDFIQIYPGHRGRGLGLLTARRLMDVFAPQDGIVLCLPCPMQFYSAGKNPATRRRLALDNFSVSESEARWKLSMYWRQLGFVPLGDSGYLMHSPLLDVPSFDELARSFDRE